MMKRRILVVEDDRSLGKFLCHNLEYEGYEVSLAFDGPAALQEFTTLRPDLVLLDVALPGVDGFEICNALTSAATRPAIIMLTAKNQKQDKVRGLQAGADDYITKP